MKVQNVRGGKIGVAENTESGICFKWRAHQPYLCCNRWEEKVSRGAAKRRERLRKVVERIIMWEYLKKMTKEK